MNVFAGLHQQHQIKRLILIKRAKYPQKMTDPGNGTRGVGFNENLIDNNIK